LRAAMTTEAAVEWVTTRYFPGMQRVAS
jgi:hypothetical protein